MKLCGDLKNEARKLLILLLLEASFKRGHKCFFIHAVDERRRFALLSKNGDNVVHESVHSFALVFPHASIVLLQYFRPLRILDEPILSSVAPNYFTLAEHDALIALAIYCLSEL